MSEWAGLADRCRSCGAAIVWAQPAKGRGRPIPLDALADQAGPLDVPGGNIQTAHTVTADGQITQLVVTVGATDPDLPTYRTHFASCPDAGKHRHKR